MGLKAQDGGKFTAVGTLRTKNPDIGMYAVPDFILQELPEVFVPPALTAVADKEGDVGESGLFHQDDFCDRLFAFRNQLSAVAGLELPSLLKAIVSDAWPVHQIYLLFLTAVAYSVKNQGVVFDFNIAVSGCGILNQQEAGVTEFNHLIALRADNMAVLPSSEGFFISGGVIVAKVMAYHQPDLRQQFHYIIHGGFTDIEILL